MKKTEYKGQMVYAFEPGDHLLQMRFTEQITSPDTKALMQALLDALATRESIAREAWAGMMELIREIDPEFDGECVYEHNRGILVPQTERPAKPGAR